MLTHVIVRLMVCGLVCFAAFAALAAKPNAGSRPNIVFVLTDDQAPTAVGIENSELKTPHMDRLFHDGARLKHAFVTTPSGSSSRATLMTSRYGSELGITDWINPGKERQLGLDSKFVTWPKLLARAGYRTGLVGKWHLGTIDRFHPTRHGFHFFAGMRGGGNTPKDPVLEIGGRRRQVQGFTPDILTDHALEFVRRNQNGPFLLCLHFRAPHIDWLPVREEDWAPYKNLDPKLPDPNVPHLSAAKLKKWTREYYASVSSVDRNVGRVLDELDKLKLADRTAIIFTSDHGYNLGHKGLWFKGNARRQLTKLPEQVWPYIPPTQRPNLFDQSLRVPAAVRWPGAIKPGTVVSQTISNLDWLPTLLEIADVEIPANVTVRGRSFLPLLRGQRLDWDNDLYVEYSMKHMAQTHMRGWRTPKWKLSIDFLNAGRRELYNLEVDPAETVNLIESSDDEAAQARERLTGHITRKMREIGDPISTDPKENQRDLERLFASHGGANETGRGWEQSFSARTTESTNNVGIHATEITHLAAHKGRLYAGDGYWMDARPGGNKNWAEVLVLDAPDARWKVDLAMGPKHLRVTALKSVTFSTDGTGRAMARPVTLLLAGSDSEKQSSVWTRDDARDTWVRTILQQGGQYKRSLRAFAIHRDQKTRIERVFAAAGELGIFSGIYDPDQPGKIRWDKKPELGPGVMRPMSFAEANGRLYASAGTIVYRRVDGLTPHWEKTYSHHGETSWAMGGIRGLTAVASPDRAGESLLFAHKGQIIRLDPIDGHKATIEARIPSLIEKNLGRPVKGHTLAAYSSMLPVTDPATGRTVHLIGVQSRLEREKSSIARPKPYGVRIAKGDNSFAGYYAGASYLIRESATRYRVKEVNGLWRPGKPILLASRSYAVSPFASDKNRLYFAGYDANFLPAVDTAWIFRASVKTALSATTEVYELRIYTANEGKLPKLHARFRDHTIRLFKKHGMEPVGFWVPADGPNSKNTLVYILKHKSREHAAASWQAFLADPAWKKVAAESQREGRLLRHPPEAIFLNATHYSPNR
jgi:uncharacterized sulfatase